MQQRLLNAFFILARDHRRAVAIAITLLCTASLLLIPGLRISTSQLDLLPKEHPVQRRYLEFLKEFGAADNLIVVLEGQPEQIRAAAPLVASSLSSESEWVRSVFYRVDPAAMLDMAPLFMTTERLQMGLSFVQQNQNIFAALATIDDLPAGLEFLALQMRAGAEGSLASTHADTMLDAVQAFFASWQSYVQNPTYQGQPLTQLLLMADPQAQQQAQSGGYFLSHDQRMLFLFVQPTRSSDDVTFLAPFVTRVRQTAARALAARPELFGEVKVALTGMPAHHLSEAQTVFSDVSRAGIIAVVLVLLVLLVGFGSVRKVLLVLLPLGCGMIMTLALARLIFGQLNLISAAFLAVLFGIGIDFGIYLMRRCEEELANTANLTDANTEAVRRALLLSGRGILTGGVTTGLAFLAVTASSFVGFSELGLIAGLGVFVVLLVTMLLLPTLLLTFPVSARRYDLNAFGTLQTSARHRLKTKVIIVLTTLAVAASILVLPRLHFNYNALELLPADAEATIYQIKMQEQSDLQMSFAVVTRDRLADLVDDIARLEKLPSVSRVESLAPLIPQNQDKKLALIARYRPFAQPLRPLGAPAISTLQDYQKALLAMSDGAEHAQELAFAAGQKGMVGRLEQLIASIDDIMTRLNAANADQAYARTLDFERYIYTSADEAKALLHKWLTLKPLDVDALPKELVQRFRSSQGRMVAYVFPRESIWDLDFLDRFVAEVSSVSADATGFPVTHRINARLAAQGLAQSLVYASLVLIVILALDFRRFSDVLLALLPLALGMLLTQGAMIVVRQDYNLANIAAFPLLLGLGVVYGVHMVHRWRERPELSAFAAAATTGRGVAFSALTTVSGIVSIVFARHNGVSSFGIVLLLGIVLCLLSALYVLPTLIDVLVQRKSRRAKQ